MTLKRSAVFRAFVNAEGVSAALMPLLNVLEITAGWKNGKNVNKSLVHNSSA